MKASIEYIDSKECFGMSGPWLGKLKVNDIELEHEFLDDNYVRSDNQDLYAFNQYDPESGLTRFLFGLIKVKTEKRKFRILVFNSTNNSWHISKDFWENLFLTRMTKDRIFFTEAFHDEDRKRFPEQSIDFNFDNFTEIEENKKK